MQYTRNMVTGASTADVALILIDARLGVLEQSRRHATIASLLGIPHLAVCVNKMDLVSWDQAVFERIREDFSAFAGGPGVQGHRVHPRERGTRLQHRRAEHADALVRRPDGARVPGARAG